ncbi:MAG TPA: hypothetical protein VEC37_01770 [Bacillota bacterium]|nr:hypothetical protein [Bacillota bacterium]
MKKLLARIFVVILIIAGCMISSKINAEETGSWKQLLQIRIPHSTTAAGFISGSHGITVGLNGECHYTLDSGKTWPRAENNSACRFGLDIVDEKIMWNCGNGANVRFSTDGGKVWKEVADCGVNGQFISFINDRTGWVAQNNKLASTHDAGTTWTNIEIPIQSIVAITLVSENSGILVDESLNLYLTNNDGKNWVTQKANINDQLLYPAIRFTDSNHGIIVGFSTTIKMEVAYLTADGGKTWKQEKIVSLLGAPYLTRDGKVLTLYNDFKNEIVVLRREAN